MVDKVKEEQKEGVSILTHPLLSCGSKFIFTTTLYVANTQCFTTYQLLLIPQR